MYEKRCDFLRAVGAMVSIVVRLVPTRSVATELGITPFTVAAMGSNES